MFRVGETPTARERWEQVAQYFREERAWDLPEETLAATKPKGRRRRHRGKRHSCGEERETQRARECRALKEGTATAARTTSGMTAQPESPPMDAAYSVSTIVLEGGELWMAEEEATRAHDGSAESGLPRGHDEGPSPHVHAQIVAAEPDPFLGEEEDLEDEVTHAQLVSAEPDLSVDELDTLEEVAHAQMVDAEPDWILWGEPTPNADAPVHVVGTGHEVFMRGRRRARRLAVGRDGGGGDRRGDRQRRGGQESLRRAATIRGQPPCHAQGQRTSYHSTIVATHHFRGCLDAALAGRQHRDAGYPRIRGQRGLGPAAAAARQGRGTS